MLTNSQYSNFGEFLKIMKNALPQIGKFLSIIVWFLTITLPVVCPNANCQRFSCYQFYLRSALGRPSTTFPVQILGKIIKNIFTSSIFPIYVIVMFNFPDLHLKSAYFFQFYSLNSHLKTESMYFFAE